MAEKVNETIRTVCSDRVSRGKGRRKPESQGK
jgi:hypothetical protein